MVLKLLGDIAPPVRIISERDDHYLALSAILDVSS